jgi:hypothetical protein
MTGCVYHIPSNYNLNTGSNNFDIMVTTNTGTLNDGQVFRFSIDENSFPELTSGSGDMITSGNFAGTANSASFIARNAGIESINTTYISNPQIMFRETEFTAIRFSVQANNIADLTLSGFDLAIM